MSFRFGPIHYWLFDQIRLVDGRTELLLDRLRRAQSETHRDIDAEFGSPIGDSVLEELVFPPAIHEGLSQLISRIERRESAVVAEFGENISGPAQVFRQHGFDVGKTTAESQNKAPSGAGDLFEMLLNVKLVGMPCDKVIQPVSSDGEKAVWRQTACLQRECWRAGGADAEAMFRLNGEWIAGFIAGLNPSAKYTASFFKPDESPCSEESISVRKEV